MSTRLLLVCTLLGPLGCHTTASGPAPSPATEAASTEPPAMAQLDARQASLHEEGDTRPRIERGETCAPGSTTIAGAGVCLKLPAAYTASAPLLGVQHFQAPDAPPITVRWTAASGRFSKSHAEAVGRLSSLDRSALQGTTRDGSGTFVFAIESQAEAHQVAHAASSVHIGEHVAWCTASAPVKAGVSRAFFEACQSLMKAG